MLEVDDALFDRMRGDALLMGMTAPYNGDKALFTIAPIPPGVEPPFISVPGTLSDIGGAGDTKNTYGREWVRDIGVYTRADGDTTLVEQMGERVRQLFHRHKLAISGFETLVGKAEGPYVAPTDKTMYGRIVTVTLVAMGA